MAADPCRALSNRPPLPDAERIRVIQLVATGTSGGAQEHVASLIGHMDRGRYDVRVLSLSDGSAVRRWRSLGVQVEVIEEGNDDAAAMAVADQLGRSQAHVVHAHMYRAEVVGVLAADLLARRSQPRPYLIGTTHSSRVRSQTDRDLLVRLTPSMDRLVAVSRSIVTKLQREGRAGTTPIDLVENGVDLARYDHTEACCTLPEEYGFPEGTQLVGVVARLAREKGHATLLDAWPSVQARAPTARLLIVGEGALEEELKAHAGRLDLLGEPCTGDRCVGTRHARPGASVVFTGRRDDIPSVTAALDVAVLPSLREAQGLVILEAMALARPVVASDVGGIPEIIEDGVTGILVPPEDPARLADAIVRLLTDHPYADRLARAGYRAVHERFCIERMVNSLQTMYDEGWADWRRRAGLAVAPALEVA